MSYDDFVTRASIPLSSRAHAAMAKLVSWSSYAELHFELQRMAIVPRVSARAGGLSGPLPRAASTSRV